MKLKLACIVLLIGLSTGCARLSVYQTEQKNAEGVGEVTTKTRAYALFKSSSALSGLQTSTEDGKQTTDLESLNQVTEESIEGIVSTAVKSALEAYTKSQGMPTIIER